MHNEHIKVRISSKPSIIMITMKWLFRSLRRINSALGDVNNHRQLSSQRGWAEQGCCCCCPACVAVVVVESAFTTRATKAKHRRVY